MSFVSSAARGVLTAAFERAIHIGFRTWNLELKTNLLRTVAAAGAAGRAGAALPPQAHS